MFEFLACVIYSNKHNLNSFIGVQVSTCKSLFKKWNLPFRVSRNVTYLSKNYEILKDKFCVFGLFRQPVKSCFTRPTYTLNRLSNNWNLPFRVSRSIAYLSRNYEILKDKFCIFGLFRQPVKGELQEIGQSIK